MDIYLDTLYYIFMSRIYFCALTFTVYNNLYQYSWLNNCVISNIKVANIVCGVDNLLISWFLRHCEKFTVTVCTVNKHLALCVLLKTYGHRVYRQQIFDIVYCGKLTDIVCSVENLLLPCVLWKTYGHPVYCGKLIDIVV